MNATERRNNAVPVSALLRFREIERDHNATPSQDLPSLRFTGLTLFTIDMSGEWAEGANDVHEKLLVVVWDDDGTRRVGSQYPPNWLDQYGHELPLMLSLSMSAVMLDDLANGGQALLTGTDKVHDALPVKE